MSIEVAFWIKVQDIILYFGDKSRYCPLHNFELTMYSSCCVALEKMCKMASNKIDEDMLNDNLDSDESTSQI